MSALEKREANGVLYKIFGIIVNFIRICGDIGVQRFARRSSKVILKGAEKWNSVGMYCTGSVPETNNIIDMGASFGCRAR